VSVLKVETLSFLLLRRVNPSVQIYVTISEPTDLPVGAQMKKLGMMAFETASFLFRKRNVVIRKEIPDGNNADCNKLGKVKILLKPAMGQPYDEVGNSQAHQAYD
jgi:hypothetical protein